jgi:predicted transcriptional regulator
MTKLPQTTNIDKLRHELAVMKKELKRYGSPQTFINKVNDLEVAIRKLEHFRDI